MKLFSLILAFVLAAAGVGLSYRYYKSANKAVNELKQERYDRMVAEENLQNTKLQVKDLEGQIKKADQKAINLENKVEKITAINEDLKLRLDKAAEIHKRLEQKILEFEQISHQL
ncbi:MAG: hypothetical protein KBD53_11570 [Candidatus Omnitrophica bacterium]|nr:hypothetical protein [Candidatus Omnitrophota bacterium]